MKTHTVNEKEENDRVDRQSELNNAYVNAAIVTAFVGCSLFVRRKHTKQHGKLLQ